MNVQLKPSRDVDTLVRILGYLRSADGCPWDRAQTNQSLVPFTLEEAYEVAEAVQQGQGYKMCEELGDLLLHIVFHSQVASEQGLFDFGDVVATICSKLIRRHPHVFGAEKANTAEEVNQLWAKAKASERQSEKDDAGLPPLPGLLLIEKYAAKIDPETVEDPLLQQLFVLVRQASRQHRCLEAEIRAFLIKWASSSRSLPIGGE